MRQEDKRISLELAPRFPVSVLGSHLVSGAMKLDDYLRDAAARLARSETPRLDARVIAKYALALDDTGLVLAGDRSLTEGERAHIDALIERRRRGEPVSQIVGEKEFFGLTFKLAPGVLTPRPDSETLVEAAIRRRKRTAPLRILDLGTGTGCLLCALLHALPKASGAGVDINGEAVALARENAMRLGLGKRARFVQGDFASAPAGVFDVIISNPPYIPEGDRDGLSPEVRDFEDPRALFAGPDGLAAYPAVLAAARPRAAPSGLIILELGFGQAAAVSEMARRTFNEAEITAENDLGGRPRALVIELAETRQKNI